MKRFKKPNCPVHHEINSAILSACFAVTILEKFDAISSDRRSSPKQLRSECVEEIFSCLISNGRCTNVNIYQ